ncbi:MAG: hypothetical protein HFE63_09560 [Clostridiales bacterium]|nr:hypothetical protein [Clostridiales bacterium]
MNQHFRRLLCAAVCILTLSASLLTACESKSTNEVDYTFYEANFSLEEVDRSINIAYPSLTGTVNDVVIDEQLKTASVEYMEQYLLYSGIVGSYRYTVDSITAAYLGDKLASFLCIGSYLDDDSSHPETIAYTLNIDPTTGKLYRFDELISDFDMLADKFRSGKFKLVNGVDGLLNATNYEDMFVEYSSLYEIYPEVYFINNDGKTELAFVVGLVYTLGGHAEFSIPVDSVKDALTDTIIDLLQ